MKRKVDALLDRLREEVKPGKAPQRRVRSFHRITRGEAQALLEFFAAREREES
jgi:hypothetical protein